MDGIFGAGLVCLTGPFSPFVRSSGPSFRAASLPFRSTTPTKLFVGPATAAAACRRGLVQASSVGITQRRPESWGRVGISLGGRLRFRRCGRRTAGAATWGPVTTSTGWGGPLCFWASLRTGCTVVSATGGAFLADGTRRVGLSKGVGPFGSGGARLDGFGTERVLRGGSRWGSSPISGPIMGPPFGACPFSFISPPRGLRGSCQAISCSFNGRGSSSCCRGRCDTGPFSSF